MTTSIRAPADRTALSFAAVLGITAIGIALFWSQIQAPWVVTGRSMGPTLRPGDRVLVDRWTYRHREPLPGEVVLVLRAGGPALVKRVASRSNDLFWVLGDNPAESEDSRQFGPLRATDLPGRVSWCYWPPSRFGPIPSEPAGR